VLCIAEGYATSATVHEAAGYTVLVAFNAAKLEAVVRALWQKFPDLHLIFCTDADANTKGNPRLTKATAGAKAVGGLIADLEFGDDRSEGASNFHDLGQCQGLDAVQSCIANATVLPPAEHGAQSDQVIKAADTVDVVRRLAVLSLIDYDRCREGEAKRLGVRRGTLGAEVSRRRSQLESSTEAGDAVLFDETRWWEDLICDAVLLTEIAGTFSRYLVLPSTG
jgi:putative DNA primase/helicase